MIARARILVCQPATVGEHRPRRTSPGVAALAREFPTVAFDVEVADDGGEAPLPTFDLRLWLDRHVDFRAFDAHVEDLARAGALVLVVRGAADEATRATCEMLTRWQRLLDRRNAASDTPVFDAVLRRLRAMHDLQKPLVLADYNHALDTWQWLLRLQPEAGLALQLAALLHDVERLESEADARVEHLAPSYSAFKYAHAERGAAIARHLLLDGGVDAESVARAASLIAGHERPDGDPGRALLNDADALSFFSQNSAGYLDYYGAEAMRRKIAYSLGRMRGPARARLAAIRLRADVAALTHEARPRAPAVSP